MYWTFKVACGLPTNTVEILTGVDWKVLTTFHLKRRGLQKELARQKRSPNLKNWSHLVISIDCYNAPRQTDERA